MNLSDDDKAKVTAGTSGLGGIIGSILAIGSAGTTVGFSAAGITSGLAAIGGIVGGGMVAGLAVTAAAPLACAGLGYLGHKGLRELKKKMVDK